MKCPKIMHPALLALFALLLAPAAALAEITLEAPEKAARGDAFIASASASQPVEDFVFFWRGKSIPVKAEKSGPDKWEAKVLLPAPLGEKASRLKLGCGAAQKPGAGVVATAHLEIALHDRPRPTQKLNVDKKYVSPPASALARIKADREKVRATLARRLPGRFWSEPFLRPVPGSVSSLFGMKRVFNGQPRSVHRGLDLRGATGTPIRACADGRVELVDNLYYSGNTVYINHGDGVFTAYMHMSEPRAQVGQMVSRGDVIGLVGATGRVTGPHLHLALISQGETVDPEPLLERPAGVKGKAAK